MHFARLALPPFLAALFLLVPGATAAEEEPEPPKLLGVVRAEQLDEEPFAEWSRPEYDDYLPDPAALDRLRDVDLEGVELSLFFGTWCGDSRREVPRILRLLDELEFPAASLRLIAVDGVAEAHKQSTGGEEKGFEIYRVPTLVVTREGREVSRLVEYPALSLERDLLAILTGAGYEPSYASYPIVRRWLAEGLLADANVSPRGLASAIRHRIASEGELAAAARVLLTRGQIAEAIKLYEVNCALHRDSAAGYARLADALVEAGDLEQARKWAERAVRLNDDPERAPSLVDLVSRTLP